MNKKLILIFTLFVLLVSVSFAVAIDDNADNLTADDAQDPIANDDDANLPEQSANTNPVADPSDGMPVASDTISVKVVWDDDNDAKGKRPSSVVVSFKYDGQPDNITLSSSDGWNQNLSSDFDPALVSDVAGQDVSGYTVKVTGDAASGYTVTYTLEKDTPDNNNTNHKKKTDHKKKSTNDEKQNNTVTKPPKKPPKKPAKDEHKTGNPILLGVLALSVAGLAVQLRKRE